MENREQQILSEIKSMMSSIRSQLELLDAKMAELQQTFTSGEEAVPIDIDIIDDLPVSEDVPVPVGSPVSEDVPVSDEADDDLPFADEPAVSDVEPEPVVLESIVVEPEPVIVEPDPVIVEPEPEPVLTLDPEPAAVPVEQPVPARQAVIDSMTEKQAWRTDMPGTQVKDIRSAISLNDRILFINVLFAQDPLKFQDDLSAINQMSDLDQAVSYLSGNHPDWDFESDVVYRFMMAVRRRIR